MQGEKKGKMLRPMHAVWPKGDRLMYGRSHWPQSFTIAWLKVCVDEEARFAILFTFAWNVARSAQSAGDRGGCGANNKLGLRHGQADAKYGVSSEFNIKKSGQARLH
jgi:hypothetical protein